MRLHTWSKLVGVFAVCLAMGATASAQYGGGGGMGGGTGTMGGGTGNTSNRSYGGSGKAIGIGVGAAAGAAVGIALLIHHHHKASSEASLIGCAQPASNGISLKSDEDGETYLLVSKGKHIEPGERVELKGVVKDDQSGARAFRVRNVVTDFGACSSSHTVASTENSEKNDLAAVAK